jgi:predicted ArsR family transcriptional regulator
MTADTDQPDPVGAIAALDEPKRRQLYDLVAGRREAVGRDEAAAATGMSRELASFHLDRLVAAGLLVAEFRRINDRRGPGAGRPAKLYRRSDVDITASFPARRYERAASMFAEAIDRLGRGPRADAATTLADVARTTGELAGTDARRQAGPRPGRRRLRTALLDLLKSAGYEPEVISDADRICLRNCPYDALVEGHRDLTCGMNLAWAEGLLDGLGDADLTATLAPRDGFCCVVLDGTPPEDALHGRRPLDVPAALRAEKG